MRSMTGFARVRKSIKGQQVVVEVRTLNHRFLDVSIKLPHQLLDLEPQIRTLISKNISRGKVELFVWLDAGAANVAKPSINEELLECYLDELKKFAKKHGIKPEIDFEALIEAAGCFPQIFELKESEISETFKKGVVALVKSALKKVVNARKKEGIALKGELSRQLKVIDSLIKKISELEPVAKDEAKRAFLQKLESLNLEQPDETRLAQEVAFLLQKLDFTEEIVRLTAHLKRISELIKESEPIGRKLDFALQECHREITTLSNKSQHLEISKIALEIKAELEKMREQVQNIE